MSADGFMLEAPPLPRTFVPWSADELAALRLVYPREGMAGAQRLFPARSVVAIYAKARLLGLYAPQLPKRFHRKHELTPEIEAKIRAFYSRPIRPGDLPRFARSINRPHWWVKLKAATLGLTYSRLKPDPWCDRSIDLLTEHAAKAPQTIRTILIKAGYRRTLSAIVNKRKTLGMAVGDEREVAGLWNLKRVARALGVADKTVLRWIRTEAITAQRRPGSANEEWEIKLPELRRFCAENSNEYDLRRVDRDDFLWIAFGDHAPRRALV